MKPSSLFAAALAMAAGGAFVPPAAAETEDLARIRAATEKYRDVAAALADGFIRDPADHCVTAAGEGLPAELGAMGVHYIHPGRLGVTATAPRVDGTGTHTDFAAPAILIYEPQADGSMELVAVENLVWLAAWEAGGRAGPPAFRGRPWDRMVDDPATPADEAHGFMPHYDQHIWLYRANPAGELEPFNPAVTCEHHAMR